MMLLDDGFGDGEAEAGAALLFGGEEGVEDFGQDGSGDAGAVVGNGDVRFFGGTAFTPNAQDSLFGQCVDGVGDEVGEHLQEVARVDFSGDIGLELFAEDDSLREIFLW